MCLDQSCVGKMCDKSCSAVREMCIAGLQQSGKLLSERDVEREVVDRKWKDCQAELDPPKQFLFCSGGERKNRDNLSRKKSGKSC